MRSTSVNETSPPSAECSKTHSKKPTRKKRKKLLAAQNMQHFDVALFRLSTPTQLLPSDGRTVYECVSDDSSPYGIRVKFMPKDATPLASWRVHVKVDGKSLGYNYTVCNPGRDGFWRSRFRGMRANEDCTRLSQMIFQEPSEGDGEAGARKAKNDAECQRPCEAIHTHEPGGEQSSDDDKLAD